MTMSNHNVVSFAIPSDNMSDLTTKFQKLARRAKKLGLQAPTFHEVKVERKVINENTFSEKVILLHHIIVDSGTTTVHIANWTFCAVIQHTEDGNILRNIGEHGDLPTKYRTCNNYCDHCKTDRFRKDTFVLRHDMTGEYKQVGRSCLQDFFGTDALMYAEQAQYLLDIDDQCKSLEDWCGGGSGPIFFKLEAYLSHVAECISKEGWLSRRAAREQSMLATADIADRHITNTIKVRLYDKVSEESKQLALDAIEWAQAIEGEDINEYLHNVRVIAKSEVCSHKTMGVAASIVSTYQRELVKLQEAARKALLPPSEYQGIVGEKGIFHLLVEKVIQCDSEWGVCFLHIMSDENGNRFSWFASGSGGALDTAKQVVLKATIKAHKEYKGTRQTVLSRCEEVELKTYSLNYNGQVYERKVICEADFKKLAKEELGIKRWSKDLKVVESSLSL